MSRLSEDAEHRARTIVEQLGGRWSGGKGQCRCPAHDDQSPSLSVQLGKKVILFKCFAGCPTSEVLSALRERRLHDGAPLQIRASHQQRDHMSLARRLWDGSVPIAGTPAADYLAARGLVGPYPPSLRYNAHTVLGSGANRRLLPAMIACAQNDLGLVAVQRTFLDLDDLLRKPLRRSKLSLGLIGDGAIRLAEVDDHLGLAEGIEDALTAIAWFRTPTWALAGVERLLRVGIPASVRRITLFADQGPATKAVLARARAYLTADGRVLKVKTPRAYKDWNQAWCARRRAH